MANPLFEELSKTAPQQQQMVNDGGFSQMLSDLEAFKRSFQGDPKAQVQQLLSSGKMSQAQFNQLFQMANQIIRFMK